MPESGSAFEGRMAKDMTIYRIGDCIKKTAAGRLDHNRSINLIHELSVAVNNHKDQNILVDLREADVQTETGDLMTFAAECAKYKSGFDNKIAVLIPDTEERIETAKRFKVCMDVQGFEFKQFTGYDEAMTWLSEES